MSQLKGTETELAGTETEPAGKEMRIRKEIKQGSVIHKEKPFVYVLSSKFRTECCDYCFNRGEFQKCSGCQYVFYCNKVCQREGWNVHKHECKSLKKVSPYIVPDAARLLARLIKILKKGGDKVQSYYTETNFRMYKDLMSHYPNIKNDVQRLEHFTSVCGVLSQFLGIEDLPNSAELMGMYGRMCVNSFNIINQELQTLGTGIYLGASVVDHSCKPNAVAVFEGTTLYIRALETLPYLDWSEIFISYIDLMNTTADRQQELQRIYYFLCQCPKCLEPEPIDGVLGAACPNPDCDNSIDMNNLGVVPKCSKCGAEISEDFIENFNEVMEFTESQLQNMSDLAYLDICKVCLKRQKGVFYRLNVKYVKTLDLAFESSINLGQFNDARLFGLELVDGYYYYYGKLHPLTGLLHFKIGKILLYQENLDTGMDHLRKAYDVLKVTHGVNSPLVKKELMPLLQETRAELNIHS